MPAEVRVTVFKGIPWTVAKDLLGSFGFNTRSGCGRLLGKVPDREKALIPIRSGDRFMKAWCLSAAGERRVRSLLASEAHGSLSGPAPAASRPLASGRGPVAKFQSTDEIWQAAWSGLLPNAVPWPSIPRRIPMTG